MSTRNHVFRMIFRFPDEEAAGSMLIIAETIELGISRGCQALQEKEGKRPEIESIGKLFLSVEEESDFFTHIATAAVTK